MADCYFRIKCLVAAELQVSALHVICAVRLDKAGFVKFLAKGKSENEEKTHCPIQKFQKQVYVATCYRYIICHICKWKMPHILKGWFTKKQLLIGRSEWVKVFQLGGTLTNDMKTIKLVWHIDKKSFIWDGCNNADAKKCTTLTRWEKELLSQNLPLAWIEFM